MEPKEYSRRLGAIIDMQFRAALARLGLGEFVRAEPVVGGLFGQNVFVTSTTGEYVLRGRPHYDWQLPAERFFAGLLHERARAPVPWPYLIDPTDDIFRMELHRHAAHARDLAGRRSAGGVCRRPARHGARDGR